MPKSHSYKRERDAEIFELWSQKDNAEFEALGTTRETMKEAQIALQGHIVMPGDPTYDQNRMLSNPVFDAAPCMIVYCKIDNDVSIALQIAARTDMPFAVRSGGHCTAGYSAGPGVLIDVSHIDHVVINAQAKTATVGTGCNFGHLNKSLAPYKLHVPGGECEGVCIGGFVQGGGLGFTSGTFGMNCDNVLALKVMLWNGSIVTATPTINRDLWWAMRGGTGGNFGVLLHVVYQLYDLTECTGWALAWPMTTAADRAKCVDVMLKLQTEYMVAQTYGSNLTLQVLMVYQNVLDPKGPKHDPKIPVFMVRGLWVGDSQAGLQSMSSLKTMPGCTEQFTITDTYDAVLDALLNNPQEQPVVDPQKGMPNEDKSSRYVADPIDAAGWTEILDFFVNERPNELTYAYLEVYGGAINAYPLTDSAFVHRDTLFNTVLDVFWYMPKDRAKSEKFMNDWNHMFEKHWNGHVYQNYVSVNVPDYQKNYWGDAVPLLYAIKMKYDPEERFRFAQQIRSPNYASGHEPAAIPGQKELQAALDSPIDFSHGVPPAPAAVAAQ